MSDKEFVEVFMTADKLIELQVVCEELKNNGIPFIVKGESAEHLYGIIVDGLAEKKIYVDREDAVRAKRLIEEVVNIHSENT